MKLIAGVALGLAMSIAFGSPNTAGVYANEEYRFSLIVPVGRPTCVAGEDAPEHGIGIYLDDGPGDCFELKMHPHISIDGTYNVLFVESAIKELQWCNETGEKIEWATGQWRRAFGGRPAATCRKDYKNGWVDVYLETQAGKWPQPHTDPEDEAPYINYVAYLHTTKERLGADLPVFLAVLKSVHILDDSEGVIHSSR